MSDLISREDAIDLLTSAVERCKGIYGDLGGAVSGARELIKSLPSAEPERKTGEWIPFTMREVTEEEHEMYPEWTFVLDCPLPNDGDNVLLTNGKYVWEDTFHNDDGCYFERQDDIEDYNGYAWMPLPEPYRAEMMK